MSAKQYLCRRALATKKLYFWLIFTSECQRTVMLMQTIVAKALSESKMHVSNHNKTTQVKIRVFGMWFGKLSLCLKEHRTNCEKAELEKISSG